MKNFNDIKAMLFDVFGTVVDWRSSIIEEVRSACQHLNSSAEWGEFANRWRNGYSEGIEKINLGIKSWSNIDSIHRQSLDLLLDEYGFGSLEPELREHLNMAWHRLQPWDDSIDGLLRLKKKFIIGTLSNGNISLLINMAKNSGLPWDVIFSSELTDRYKPDVKVYTKAAELLDLPSDKIIMVAAHSQDLIAAKSAGLKTAFVSRPKEFGDNTEEKDQDSFGAQFDVYVNDFVELAQQLGT